MSPPRNMADTRAYHKVEEWVRSTGLSPIFPGVRFAEAELPVGKKEDGTTAVHSFDAVAEDQSVVASIKAGAGRTRTGRAPTGQVKDCYTEVLFLSLALGARKVLVFTDRGLFDEFSKVSDGKRPPGIELLHVPLPSDLESELLVARRKASNEVAPRTPGDRTES